MIISPPFLPAKPAGASLPDPDADALWVDKAMEQPQSRAPDSHALEGSFPLSAALMWHNGIHIQAPLVNNAYLPVRAVADGKVIYAKEGAKPNANKHDPQNYYPWSAHDIGWSDNGIVIIEHDNEIGATKDAPHTPTRIRFYSLYMHLSSLGKNDKTKAAWKAGDVIHRKDELGTPGQIYGHAGQIHFEICCDKANLEKIIGRPPGWREFDPHVAPTADGRTDSVFGSIVVYLPATTPTQTQAPTSHRRSTSTTTIGAPQWVRIRYDKGTAFVQSFGPMGEPMGAEIQDKDFEYNMYTEANRRHKNLGTSDSSPSGWYELLRFGRNLGPDKLPLDAAHWRSIPKAGGGSIWADLNAAGTFKFSDADFLPEMGWNCFDDDATPHDQCLDSINMRLWIHDRERKDDHKLKSGALAARLGEASVQKKLRRAICLFPSEWDRSTIQARYQWLRKEGASDSGLSDESKWQTFVQHCEAMTFDDLPQAYLNAQLRFHPSEFVCQMRHCGWLSLSEMASTFPRHLFYENRGNPRIAITKNDATYTLRKAQAESRLESFQIPLNQVLRKYIGWDQKRVSIFLAQTLLETAQWRNLGGQRRLMHEWGFGAYSPANPATQHYGPFYGRGAMQLTWAGNYKEYGDFRKLPDHHGPYEERLSNTPRITSNSKHYSANPKDGGHQFVWSPRFDPDLVGENPYAACDSGGLYWASKQFSEGININRVADRDYSPTNVGFVNRLVNGGGNGFYERQAYTYFMLHVLGDSLISQSQYLIIVPGKNNVEANLLKPN